MGRPKDEQYWNQVTKEENGTLKCKHCGLKFKGGVSRIKAHVDRIQGKGVRICSSINRDNEGVQNNIISGSNNSQEAINAMTTLPEDKVNFGDQLVEHDSAAFESMDRDIEKAFFYREGDPDAVPISKSDIELLQPEKYINDNIIDFYINYLKNKLPTDKQDRFHFFNCFFFPKLADLGKDNPSIACDGRAAFQRVSNWTKKVNLFEKDYILIPINYSLHWSLIVICHPGEVSCYNDEQIKESSKVPCILHMDSRKGIHEGLHNVFQSYLCEEWKERHSNAGHDVSFKFLHLPFISLVLPQQENSYDCGLFLLHYVERFLEQAPINFNRFTITKFSNFLCSNWFPPPEASLKRSHIQKLIYDLLGVVEGNNEMIVGGSVNPQYNTQSTALLGGWVAEDGVNGSSNVNVTFQSEISELNQLIPDLITREEEDINGQLQCLESHGKKPKHKREVDDWLNELQDMKKRAVGKNNSLDQLFRSTNFYVPGMRQMIEGVKHGEIRNLIEQVRKHKAQKPLVLSSEFVGEKFEENVEEMWDLLEDDKVFIIGIHGMGGVGKTFLATYMESEIKRKGIFKHVFWVTVSHDFTIFKLQHHIAEKIRVKLYGVDERNRATILTSELKKIEKSVLILDDVWEYIDLLKVGIPHGVNGIKLIITTRLKHVCQQMDCLPHNIITISTLSHEGKEDEDWELFLLKLGHRGTLPPEVGEIATSIVKRCEGLPLGISVMARTMKGRDGIRWWRHALNKLEKLEMGEEVLTVLKRSYDNLIEEDMQKCFLFCALLPGLGRHDLVRKIVESGRLNLNGKRSWGEIFDEGHIIVDKLIDHSLLLLKKDEDKDKIGMHGLVRNMACYILNRSHSNVMVKCNQKLRKIPHVREWTVDLETVSLVGNEIEEIAEGTSPNCPRLSTFILSDNCISHIPECFFTHMNALTILDLSNNHGLTSLSKSLSNLRSLTSLVLRGCSKLEYIPPLGELRALSRLDISRCSILQVPEGLENLINLKWLDLSGNYNLTLVPGCVLSGLTNMQYLDLHGCSGIKVEDVQGMTMLEFFAGSFLDHNNYNRYVTEIQDSGYGPQTYFIHLDWNWLRKEEEEDDDDYKEKYYGFNRRNLWFGDCEKLPYFLPRDLGELFVSNNNQWVYLCDALSPNGSSSWKKFQISGCIKLESLFCLLSSCSSCTSIQNVKSLSHLTHFEIRSCHKIKTLLTPKLVAGLQNLESIIVSECDSMEEIFAVSNNGDDDNFDITLPKLTRLELSRLPELKTVCEGNLVCGSEKIWNIYGCPKLDKERLPRTRRYVAWYLYS